MTPEQDAVDQAVHALTAAILSAVRAELELDRDRPDRLLSVAEACEVMGLSRSTFYLELQAGRIRALRVGRRVLIPSSSIAEYIAAGTGWTRPDRAA